MTGPTQQMLEFACDTNFDDLPPGVVHEAKRILLDSLGVGVAALDCDKGRLGRALALRLGGPAESTILGTSDKVSCANAAFANGELINALDFCAYTFPVHPPGAIIPAPIAIGEGLRAPGKDLLLAIALGYEISYRFAISLRSLRRGFTEAESVEVGKIAGTRYPVSTSGALIIGGTIGAGRMAHLQPQQMGHAVGLAAHFFPIPSTKWRYLDPVPMTKYGSNGWLSLGEVTAVLLAQMGYTADTAPLDGELGLWRYFGSNRWDAEAFTAGLGAEWRMMGKIEYKPYPCWGDAHLALDCLIQIIEEQNLAPDDIEWINIQGNPTFTDAHHKTKNISDHLVAQFSLPYVVAAAVNRIGLGEWQDPERISDPKLMAFMEKVHQEAHPEFAKVQLEEPYSMMTRVQLSAKGRTFAAEGRFNRGFSMSDEELIQKFRGNALKVLPSSKVEKAIETVLRLEDVEDINRVMAEVSL